jgi:4-hydroxy-4-methyl-2-oxoglutarate aldolase
MPEVNEVDESFEGSLEDISRCGAATVHEAAGPGTALPHVIRPLIPGRAMCGPALTVETGPGDNLWIHRAVYAASPGDVLVISCSGVFERGYWGEILSVAAAHRNLGGVVIDGCARDIAALQTIGLPIFARGLCVRGTSKGKYRTGSIGEPIWIGDVVIRTGDVVIGDGDGVVRVRREGLEEVVRRSQLRMRKEEHVMKGLAEGGRTMDLLGFGED